MATTRSLYKVAVVRNTWTYFYLLPPTEEFFYQLTSSIHNHVGPLGLWNHFETELITIDDGMWLQRIALEAYYMGTASDKTIISRLKATRAWSVRSHTIDWDKYDLILCLDSVIPKTIIRRHPKPVWAIFLTSPSPSLFVLQRWPQSFGHTHMLLDQVAVAESSRIDSIPQATKKFPFPLSFFRSGDLLALAKKNNICPIRSGGKNGIHIEKHCGKEVTANQTQALAAFGPVTCNVPRASYFPTMVACKYFLVTHSKIRYLKGHSLLEANGFGCLVLVRKGVRLASAGLVLESMEFDSFTELLDRLEAYEKDPRLFARDLLKQQAHFDACAFDRPKRMLETICEQHKASRSIRITRSAEVRDVMLTSLYPLFWIVFIPIYRLAFNACKQVTGKSLDGLISLFLHRARENSPKK